MRQSVTDRRSAVFHAREAVRSRLAAAADLLRDAPAWWRPDTDPERMPGRLRGPARHLGDVADEIARDRALIARLDEDIAAIDHGEVDMEAAHRAALEWFNTLDSARALRDEVVRDPVSEARAPGETFDRDLAEALLRVRDEQPGRRIGDLAALEAVPGVTDTLLADLLRTGLERLPRPPIVAPARRPLVGVMLPARLETRFDPPAAAGASWHLRLRVVPDTPWFDAHDPTPTDVELNTVERLWRRVGDAGLEADAGRIAWREFVAVHGGGRAVWLARTFPPVPSDDGGIAITRPAAIRTEPAVNRLEGLPRALEVWLGRGGAAPTRVASLAVDPAALDLMPGDPADPEQRRWWESWDTAVAAGLAARIDVGPADPADIDVLYVVGIGDTEADALFADHRDSGGLAVIAPGTPTNTVDGAPAADLGHDPATWRPLVTASPLSDPLTTRLSEALTGERDTLGPLPGGGADHTEVGSLLVTALWPVLWGHQCKDVWGLGRVVHEVGLWAGHNVFPEGPLPAVRIGTQPYGVLPVTSLEKWMDAAGDPAFEADLAGPLVRLRRAWARTAEGAGTVEGAGTERLMDLLGRTASSAGYAWRHFVARDVLLLLIWSIGEAATPAELDQAWERAARPVLDLLDEPTRRLFTVGSPQDLDMPLVTPTNLPEGRSLHDAIKAVVEVTPGLLTHQGWWRELLHGADVPDSLLFRLIVHALVLTAAEAARAGFEPPPDVVLEPLYTDAATPTRLATDARKLRQQDVHRGTPEALLFAAVRDAALGLEAFGDDHLERALRATLDTASHRVDPFVTAFAWRRLQALQSHNPRHVLGLYAWVDRPFTGTPGPTAGGLLHTPSDSQALTAAILRDKAVNDPEADRWDMDVHSARARLADRLAAEVRLGAHISEALGRQVERLAGTPSDVEALRDRFPIRTEEAGRRVCDGLAVLDAAPADLPLTPVQISALQPLRDALDTYGDLLVAEAVQHVVEGRGDIAGAAMDAAAGLGRPPDLDVLRTPRPGRTVHTLVVVAVPDAAAPATAADTSPATVADPAVAAFVASSFGAPDGDAWRWRFQDAGGATHDVFLDDLGLAPVDTVVVSAGTLRDLAAAQAPDGSDLVEARGGETHEQVRRAMGVFGTRPATRRELADGPADEDAERTDLLNRYQRLHDVANLLLAALAGAASDADRHAALRNALRWGITPLDVDAPDAATRVGRARAALETRLTAAPDPAAAASLDTLDIARAIAELAAPEGNLAVLGRVDIPGLTAEGTDPGTGLPDLDAAWLDVVAAVRLPLGRLQALQLEAAVDPARAPLAAWTNRPGDPWQQAAPVTPEGRAENTRLVAVYGPAGTLDGAGRAVAAGVLDVWAEVVPDTEQTRTTAFGFNAPASRPQQAILVAVPPDEWAPLDTPTLVDILGETRELTRARMVTPRDVAAWSAALPTVLLRATGTTAVDLDP